MAASVAWAPLKWSRTDAKSVAGKDGLLFNGEVAKQKAA
jgi:hypothetical protein